MRDPRMDSSGRLQAYLRRFASTAESGGARAPVPVVVLGLCKHGLYLTRNFARHGIPVVAIASDLNASTARSRYGFKLHCVDANGPSLMSMLESLKRHLPQGTPIFATNDKMVDTLLAHYADLADHYCLPFLNSDLVTRLKDKAILHQLAEQAGLPVPRSHTVGSLEELASCQAALRFPVAVKPTLPMSSFKSRRCDTLGELQAQVEASAALGESLIVQEWIEGDDRAIMFGAYYIGRDGDCRASYAGRKLMSYPPMTGHAAATESGDIGERLEEGYRFLRDLGYWGLCSIEYKGMPPESARFIEVTVGRCDWWIMCCGINGVDIPMAAYNDLTGMRIPFRNAQTSQYIWHDVDHSLPVLVENFLKGRWSLGECARFLLHPRKDAVFDVGDLGPFVHSVPAHLRAIATKFFKYLHKIIKG